MMQSAELITGKQAQRICAAAIKGLQQGDIVRAPRVVDGRARQSPTRAPLVSSAQLWLPPPPSHPCKPRTPPCEPQSWLCRPWRGSSANHTQMRLLNCVKEQTSKRSVGGTLHAGES